MEEKNIKDQISSALVHFSYNFFIYFIFIVPFDLWKKATIRLANQKEKGAMNILKSSSAWPFLSFLKAFFLEFLIDGFIFMSYIVGLLITLYTWYSTNFEIEGLIYPAATVYFFPVILSLYRDLLQLSLLPIKKFLDWASKPAQYMDLEIKNK